jgi:hypothetical protein
MTAPRLLVLAASHGLALLVGFAAGIYVLPILVAPDAPAAGAIEQVAGDAVFRGQFRRELKGSDLLHWGEGEVLVGRETIALRGRLAPGPDYKLYLSPVFVEDEAGFLAARASMVRVGEVRSFDGFLVPLPAGTAVERYTTVVVWCERFGEFISAARYR